jgi:hypothetical protein
MGGKTKGGKEKEYNFAENACESKDIKVLQKMQRKTKGGKSEFSRNGWLRNK